MYLNLYKYDNKNDNKNDLEKFSGEIEAWNLHDAFEDYTNSLNKLKSKNRERDKNFNKDTYNELSMEDLIPYDGDGIYRKIPHKDNSIQINYSMDDGILKNMRAEGYVNTYKNEISYDKMNKIINEIKNENIQKILLPKKFKNSNNNQEKLEELKKCIIKGYLKISQN